MAQYLSPRNDYGFKKLFGNKDHKNLTISFLNAILGKTKGNLITEIVFEQTEKFPERSGERRSFLDVHCTDQNDKNFIIEMQNEPQSFFFERMIYYASLVYSRQKPSSFSYEYLKPVIFIGILSEKLNDTHPDPISEHAIMNTKYNTVSSQHMMYYLVELEKFTKQEHELETDVDKWLFFMQQADSCKQIPTALQHDKKFIEAFDVLEQMRWSESEYFKYLAAFDAIARDKGIEHHALQRGIEQGIVTSALSFLKMGLSVEKVAEGTGLSVAQVEALLKDSK